MSRTTQRRSPDGEKPKSPTDDDAVKVENDQGGQGVDVGQSDKTPNNADDKDVFANHTDDLPQTKDSNEQLWGRTWYHEERR